MKRLSRKTLIIIIATLVLLTGSASAWYVASKSDEKSDDQAQTVDQETKDEQFEGPTDQEKQDAEANKDEVVKQQEVENQPQSGQKAVTPVITNASQTGQEIFAGGYVPGVFEDGGTCTFAFSKGSSQITKTSSGFGNASTTNCTNVTVARSEFSETGSWTLIISYSSSKAKGFSQPKTFTVQ